MRRVRTTARCQNEAMLALEGSFAWTTSAANKRTSIGCMANIAGGQMAMEDTNPGSSWTGTGWTPVCYVVEGYICRNKKSLTSGTGKNIGVKTLDECALACDLALLTPPFTRRCTCFQMQANGECLIKKDYDVFKIVTGDKTSCVRYPTYNGHAYKCMYGTATGIKLPGHTMVSPQRALVDCAAYCQEQARPISCDTTQCTTVGGTYAGAGNSVCCPSGEILGGDGSACQVSGGSLTCSLYGPSTYP